MVNSCTIFSRLTGASCPLCRQPGAGVCPSCVRSLPYNRHACPRCALPLPETVPAGVWCADCQASTPAFDRILAPLLYQDPIDELVAGFKYRQQLYLGPSLADICIDDINTGTAGVQLLLPVPMRPRALRERGFNQAAELARQFSRRLDIPWAGDRLFKTGGSRHQQTLNRAQRRRNVRATFACRNAVPPAVALIDDVVTTGATVEEASRVLKRAGAERVEAWAVARTPRA